MKASEIIGRVGIALNDVQRVRWTLAELVNYINDGQRQIVMLLPDANAVTASIKLDVGTRQRIPATAGTDPNGVAVVPGIRLLRLTRNMGVDGMTPGRAIRETSRAALDNELPDWHAETPSLTVQNFVYDNVAPKQFHVYPPAQADVYVEAIYSGIPKTVEVDQSGVTAGTDDLDLPDEYLSPLVDYVLARCYAKDAEFAGNTARATAYMQTFSTTIGMSKELGGAASAPQAATPTPAAVPELGG